MLGCLTAIFFFGNVATGRSKARFRTHRVEAWRGSFRISPEHTEAARKLQGIMRRPGIPSQSQTLRTGSHELKRPLRPSFVGYEDRLLLISS